MKKQSTLFFLLILVMSLSSVFDAKAQNTPSDFYSYTSLGDNLIGKKLSLSDGFKAQLNKVSGGSYTYNNITWKTGDPLPSPYISGHEWSVGDMSRLFEGCDQVTSIDLSNFQQTYARDMSYMFADCSNLTTVKLAGVNTTNLNNVKGMFRSCSKLVSIDFGDFNTSKVTDMGHMFYGCLKLASLDLSKFDTSKVTNMMFMFYSCSDLTDLNIRNFDTSKVTDMSFMFDSAFYLTSLDLSSFDGSSLINANRMFHLCRSLTFLDLSNFNIITPTHGVNVENMFYGCSMNVAEKPALGYAFNEAHVELFNNPQQTGIDTNNLRFQVANTNFYNYISIDNGAGYRLVLTPEFKAELNKASGGSYTYEGETWKTGDPLPNPSMPGSIITDMSGLFANCDLATSLDLSYFNTSTVTHMNSMFLGCISLTSLNINNFNTANVIDMGNMFSGVSSITTLNLDNFNTSKVTDMESMFCGCNSLESLDLSKFNTSLVTDMSSMFDSAEKLSFLYLSNFDASSLITANRMFHMCSKITYLDLSNFNIINPTHSVDVENMYLGCSRFVSGARAVGFAIDDANAELFNDPAKTNIDTAKLLFQTKDAQTAFYIYKYDNGAYKLELTPAFKEQLNKASGGMLVDGDYTWRTGNPLPNPCPHGFFNNKVVSDMSLLFADCSSATSIDLSLFTPMYVKNTSGMFMNCSSLTSLDLMSFDAISIENISRMFYNCGAATNGTPAVGYAQSEEQATIFNNPQFTSIDTNKLRFVEGLDLSKFYVYSEVAEGYRVLLTSEFSEQLNKASGGVYTVGRYTWRTGDPLPNPAPNGKYRGIAVASFGSLFYGLSAVKTLDLSLFNTSNVQYMIAMFGECSSLTSLNLSSFNTSKVVNLGQMFNGCSSLTELDLSNFDISNETYLGTMFLNCGKATNGVPAIGYAKDAATAALFNDFSKTQIDLTKIRFRNASAPDFYTYGYSNTGSGLYVAMSTEFRAEVNKASGGYYQYGDIIWQTGDPLPNPAPDGMYEGQPVTDMMSLFSECSAATSLDLSLFNTTNVVNMSFMFNNCSSLTELDLTSFQTPKLTMLERMFYNCSAITMLDLSSFDLLSPVLTRSNERVLYMNEMLLDCGSSSGGSSYTAYAKDQAHIDLFSNSTLTKLDDTKLRFEVSTGIENVDNSDLKVYSQGGTIYLDGLDGQAVAIYSATGMLVYQAVVTSESLSVQLPRGIYLVKIGASIFKIAM